LNPLPYLFVLAAYLLGSIPFGLILATRVAGVNIREKGSGNIGATNVARTVGKKLGAITLLLDAAKGLLPVLVAERLLDAGLLDSKELVLLSGMAAFLGHCFPIYLRFRGGKGVATAFGVFLAVAPVAALAGFLCWGLVYAVFRISSLGSLLAAVVVPALICFLYDDRSFFLACAIVLVIVAKHRGNLQRILTKVEGKV